MPCLPHAPRGDILDLAGLEPVAHDRCRFRIFTRCRRLREDAQVGRLLLHCPVQLGQAHRGGRVAAQRQLETRLFALVHAVAAAHGGVETRRQFGAGLAGTRRLRIFQGDGVTQEQRIGLGLVLQKSHHLGCAVALEQEIGVGAQQVAVVRIQRQRFAVVGFGLVKAAEPCSHFTKQGRDPGAQCGGLSDRAI